MKQVTYIKNSKIMVKYIKASDAAIIKRSKRNGWKLIAIYNTYE